MEYPLQQATQQIKEQLNQVLSDLKYPSEVKLEIPPEKMGDFAYPCFHLAPLAKQSPVDIAKKLKEKIHKIAWVERIEANAGYVNFFLDTHKLITATLTTIHKTKNNYGCLSPQHKKVIIEHTSANPTGPLHVGRARNPIIGDTMVRIFRAAGYDTESQYYLDDMGKQVAMLTWGLRHHKVKKHPASMRDKPDHHAVSSYQQAADLMKHDPNVAAEIANMVQQSEQGNEEILQKIHQAYTPVLDGILTTLHRMNIDIDTFIPESQFVKDHSVDKVVEQLKKSPYCNIEDQAYYLDLKTFGIKGRNTKFFFVRGDGTTLYATRDIAYHQWKAQCADILINVLGEDHKLESKQVEIALQLLKTKRIPQVIFYAFVSLPGGKMSTRKGRVVYIDDLMDECVARAYNEVKQRRSSELAEQQMKKIAEIIGIGALRYNIIKVQPEKDIEFHWEDALNFEGNAAPFIQYAHARACRILAKKSKKVQLCDTTVLTHQSEINLIKKLAKFPFVIEEACQGFKPHILPVYLNETSSQFNQFYRDCPVLAEKNQVLHQARLLLVSASAQVLRNGLRLLGITAPEEM
jgi:arginyl-tRNA synthetase